MPDVVEVALKSALLNRLKALTFSPVIPVALPNVSFQQPTPGPGVRWLRATILPATSFALGIDWDGHNQHYGLMQVDVFYGQGVGELAPSRVAGAVVEWFQRGTRLVKDGFAVKITKLPYLMTEVKDDPWVMLPVCIPYLCFANNS